MPNQKRNKQACKLPRTLLNYAHLSQRLGIATPRTLRRRVQSLIRGRLLVDLRIAIAAVLYERGYTYEEIADELHRAQSLIHHYQKMHENLTATNAAYCQMVEQVRDCVRGCSKTTTSSV